MFIGEAFVTAVIKKVVEKGFEYVEDQWEWQRGMKTELRKLQDYLPQISAVVKAAANIRDNDDLKKWLWQLRDAVYDAEDVLDDLEYLRLKKQVEAANEVDGGNSQVFIGGLSQSREKLIKIGNRAFKSDPVLKNLREVVRKLDEVAAGVGNFLHLISLTQQQQHHHHHHQQEQQLIEEANRQTGSLPTERRFFGRVKEMEEVLQLLTTDHHVRNGRVSLVSIVGHGGMGKTTLVQNLYAHERIVKHFELRIWIHVSNKFDVLGLTKKILEGVIESRPNVDSLDLLQNQLKEKLMASKRFMLVLDDAWNEKVSSNWGKLFAPLVHGPTGSKILLTTRMKTVAEMAEKELVGATIKPTIINLKGLEEHDQLLLFNEHAFSSVDPNDYKKMRSIGEKIARKLGGSPLAAKVVGDMLNSNINEEYWENVLRNNILNFEEGEKAIMSALELSYLHLPEHLRPCFAYCSVFPPHYRFGKDDLIYMWMTMGFIQQSSQVQGEMLEDIGSRYFDYLVKRSFLEPDSSFNFGKHRYIIHDLLHEMAKIVSRDECLMFLGDTSSQEIPKTVRHLSFTNTNPELLANVHNQDNIPKLRTLHLVYDEIGQEHIENFKKILEASKCARVLTISAPIMEVLRDAIGVMTHLKYLRVLQRYSGVQESSIRLPDSLCKMYNLQAINLAEPMYCRKFDLPTEMSNTINLRHLIPDVITEGIAGVGKLTSLMELVFAVEEETGHKIRELKGINQLRRLKIKGLENVRNGDEAIKAELHSKKFLKELTLEWSRSGGRSDDSLIELDEQVLDGLRPSPNIKELSIKGYMGSKSADWMEPRSLENLHSLKIESCPAWKQILPLEKLPYLKSLSLRYMPAVESIDFEAGGFQQLQELYIRGLKKWKEWWCCSHLRKLRIGDCPELKVLPDLPLSLEEMWLERLGLTAVPKLCCSSSKSSSSSSSLSVLRIIACDQLKTLAEGLLVQQHHLGALRCLTIQDCKGLLDLPVEGFQHLCSLKELELEGCNKLQQLAEVNTNADNNNNNSFLPSSLEVLTIERCGELDRSLPRILQGVRSLSKLCLTGCNNMTSLPHADVMRTLTSLQDLEIGNCKELASVVEGLTAISSHHLSALNIRGCSKLVEDAAAATGAGGSHEFKISKDLTSFAVEHLIIDDLLLLRVEPLRSLKSVTDFYLAKDCSSEMEMVDVIEPWLLQNKDTLQYLSITSFSLSSLPASLKDLSLLETLELRKACSLQSLPQLPQSLQLLNIRGSNAALKERCKKDTGADWPNIKHISDIYIR